ncbi:MAG: hypothetical protein RQM90_04530 [Methanoculleus sp.]
MTGYTAKERAKKAKKSLE